MKHYKNKNIPLAKSLRKNMTPWERKLWYCFLKNHSLKFYRQRAIGNYIADFYCSEAKLIIELDGSQHFDDAAEIKDRERTEYFERLGLAVMRIPNNEIDRNFRGVCEYIDTVTSPPPSAVPLSLAGEARV